MRGLALSEEDRNRIVTVVRQFSGDDVSKAALWRETVAERRGYPGAKTTVYGMHFDSRLFKALVPSEDEYLAFIVLHELSHLVHRETDLDTRAYGLDGIYYEVRASIEARDALAKHGVVSKEKAESLRLRWERDFLNPGKSRLFHRMAMRGATKATMSPNQEEVKRGIDNVFRKNHGLNLHDHRKEYPWSWGFIGDLRSDTMFVAENPSLQGLRKSAKNKRLQDPGRQWGVSPGDRVFRKALVRGGFKDGPPLQNIGWHCYVTNVVKVAAQPLKWKAVDANETLRIVEAFAPVLQKEIDLMRPRMIVIMGGRAKSFFSYLLRNGRLKLPDCRVEYVSHYAEFNYHGSQPEKRRKYFASFARLRCLLNSDKLA